MSNGEGIEIIRSRAAHGAKKARVKQAAQAAEKSMLGLPESKMVSIEAVMKVPEALAGKADIAGSEVGQVQVEIMKRCLNPRLVLAKYMEGGSEKQILVRVGVNANFRRGMMFVVERPSDWRTRVLPWEYHGRRPRLPGRW